MQATAEEWQRAAARKSDYVKMSVTVPPAVFDQLQDLSRARRKSGEPYTMSQLVREALTVWLSQSAPVAE